MNILVIGNGFDIAHGLPTTYKDFLLFIRVYAKKESLGSIPLTSHEGIDNRIVEYVESLYKAEDKDIRAEYRKCIENNLWIKHFLRLQEQLSDRWNDFENEISAVIQALDGLRVKIKAAPNRARRVELDPQQVALLADFREGRSPGERETYYNIENEPAVDIIKIRLEEDLQRLVRAFEIYIDDFVNTIKINKKLSFVGKIKPDYVLSFNYSSTYERQYSSKKHIIFDYIHGKAVRSRNPEDTDIILGIEEYLSEPDKNTDNFFIPFKKFYQRILKRTGCVYKDWLNIVERDASMITRGKKREIHRVYFHGHSFSSIDGDVLREILLTNGLYTTIYYHNKESLGKIIASLVKIIGENELISQAHGNNPYIEFKEITE